MKGSIGPAGRAGTDAQEALIKSGPLGSRDLLNKELLMRFPWLIPTLLVVVTLMVFWQTCGFEFIYMDDDLYLIDNPRVWDGLTWPNTKWAFTSTEVGGLWQPLTWLTFFLDAQLFGKNASGFHFTNTFIHIVNTLLLYRVLTAMTGDRLKCGFVAALFAIHPLHVESVAWVVERQDLLSVFFGLLCMLAYIRFVRQRSTGWFVVAWLTLACSLMSKQMLVTLPFVLLLLDYWPLRRIWGQPLDSNVSKTSSASAAETNDASDFSQRSPTELLIEKIPFFALTVLFSVITFVSQSNFNAVVSLEVLPLDLRIANSIQSYASYIARTFCPFGLAVFYPHPKTPLFSAEVGIAAFVIATVSVIAIRQAKKRPFLVVGWLWYVGTLVPVIGLVQVGDQQMADRFTYFPLIGLFIALTWYVGTLLPTVQWARDAYAVMATVVILGMVAISFLQTSQWRDSVSLFHHSITVTNRNSFLMYKMGWVMNREERYDVAIPFFREALRIDPNNAKVYGEWGVAESNLGHIDEAVNHYQRAAELDSNSAIPHFNLANIKFARQQYNAAFDHIQKALSIDPASIAAHVKLAQIHQQLGQTSEAIETYERALNISPDNVQALAESGILLFESGRQDEALGQFHRALEIEPLNANIHTNVGILKYKQENYQAAFTVFQKALKLNPGHSMAREYLSLTYMNLGIESAPNKLEEAVQLFFLAVETNPNNAVARFNLAKALSELGADEEAVAHYEAAIKISPNWAEAHDRYGMALMKQNQHTRAVVLFREAIRLKPDFALAKQHLQEAVSKTAKTSNRQPED